MSLLVVLFPLILFECFAAGQDLPFKAVNLGGWLVIEGWMTPSLFDAIPNNDLLDGTQVHFKSVKLNKYLCAENGGGSGLVVNRNNPKKWETFRLWRINETTFNFRVSNKDFVGFSTQGKGVKIVAHAAEPGTNGTFNIVRNGNNPSMVRIQASNGLYLQAETENAVTADYSGSLDQWQDEDPSIFEMHIVKTIRGEYQLTNGYGLDEASTVMKNHWSTYIVEDDFRFMSQNGVNAVRIPVGWWIMYDYLPPSPFVGGSLQALDNSFEWARNYNVKVILDLHAVQGSQNGNHHSGSRDGFIEWGDSKILETVAVIDFLARRYGEHPSLAAIELMNEPVAPNVTLGSLKEYYKAGYEAVRTYTETAYVILSNRLGEADNTELLKFAAGLNHSVIDVHYYNRYSDYFKSLNAQQNSDYIYKKRSKDLEEISHATGPLIFVGEWTAALYNEKGASRQDYQKFAKAQTDVYGKASFGWAYWSYRCEQKYWSFRWMAENNYINLG